MCGAGGLEEAGRDALGGLIVETGEDWASRWRRSCVCGNGSRLRDLARGVSDDGSIVGRTSTC